jgi:predicted CXXCH cytochrome family protein
MHPVAALLTGLLLAACALPAVGATPSAIAHTENDQMSCSMPKCHDALVSGASVHAPAADSDCAACHVPSEAPEGPNRKAYRLAATGVELCQGCHDEVAKWNRLKFPHDPSSTGDCASCHLPHNSTRKHLLAEGTDGTVCYDCHDDFSKQHKVLHDPVGTLDCTACHDPHASDKDSLLRGGSQDVCFSCHEDQMEDFARAFRHKPAADGCVTCHDPHGAADKTLTKRAGGALCAPCHKARGEAEAQGISPHKRLGEVACTMCHTPHSSEYKQQLRSAPAAVCVSICHQHVDIIGLQKLRPVVHKPLAKGLCFDCHTPHASSAPSYLKRPLAGKAMQPYEKDTFDFCWSCHARTLVETLDGTGVTGFRNGDQNLHSVHVVDEQHSCRLCHEEHAATQPALLRTSLVLSKSPADTSAFSFSKQPDGGICFTTCHGQISFDRVQPVEY